MKNLLITIFTVVIFSSSLLFAVPRIETNSSWCLSTWHGAEVPDKIGEGNSYFCGKWVPLEGNILDLVKEMSWNEDTNESDYDIWTTELYVVKKRYVNPNHFSYDDIVKYAKAFGVKDRYLENFTFQNLSAIDSLEENTISHDKRFDIPVRNYIWDLLGNGDSTLINFGEGLEWGKNKRFSIIITDGLIIFMRHICYDA